MAYVAISAALVASTVENINKMCEKEIRALGDMQNSFNMSASDPAITNLVWGNHIDLRHRIPESWLQYVSMLNIHIDAQVGDETKTITVYARSISDKYVVPCKRENGYDSAPVAIPESHSFAQTICAKYIEQWKKADEIKSKWSEIKEQVREFLKASKSLNEAVKLWPALTLYIEDTYITRVNAGVASNKTVSRAAEVLAQIKTDEITAAAVNHKLSV
jgi:hypothetical protein